MLELKLVDFETAKRLSKLGFPQNYDDAIYCVRDCYSEDGDYRVEHKEGDLVLYPSGFSVNDWITAPSLELVKKWMMEYSNYYVHVFPTFYLSQEDKIFRNKYFKYEVRIVEGETLEEYCKWLKDKEKRHIKFDAYDDALECGIKEALGKIEESRKN